MALAGATRRYFDLLLAFPARRDEALRGALGVGGGCGRAGGSVDRWGWDCCPARERCCCAVRRGAALICWMDHVVMSDVQLYVTQRRVCDLLDAPRVQVLRYSEVGASATCKGVVI